ncbi:Quinone oxidoreductase-like protein 1 [Zootermopsis nevadensis]|uniref:Quinone oxidoreductase-like protein 1 n=2 Tax=Zootermopsis nevadensis TaxID=136037 RepID=A0A067QXE1_ZOONE|nr:Quinone oxidoreductase-like protein 1 [Zootermopsis nevadensis]
MSRKRTAKSIFVDIRKGCNSGQVQAREVELPELGRNGLLIQVKACGLSISKIESTALCQILSNPNKNLGVGAGHEVAGTVVATGDDVTTLSKGDHVVGIIPLDYGQSGCADYVALQEFDVVIKPHGVSFVDAAGCIGDSVKAYTALHYLGKLSSGDTVLVLDGASSFGSICIQLAHHWGAKVLTTSSSEDEKLYLQNMEVELAQIIELNEKNSSLKSAAMLETGNLGVDIVVDQGIAQYPQSSSIYDNRLQNSLNLLPSKHDVISCLAVGGRWITSNSNLQLDPPNSRLMYLRCASLGFLFEQAWMLSSAQQGRYQHILMDIMEKVATKTIR